MRRKKIEQKRKMGAKTHQWRRRSRRSRWNRQRQTESSSSWSGRPTGPPPHFRTASPCLLGETFWLAVALYTTRTRRVCMKNTRSRERTATVPVRSPHFRVITWRVQPRLRFPSDGAWRVTTTDTCGTTFLLLALAVLPTVEEPTIHAEAFRLSLSTRSIQLRSTSDPLKSRDPLPQLNYILRVVERCLTVHRRIPRSLFSVGDLRRCARGSRLDRVVEKSSELFYYVANA